MRYSTLDYWIIRLGKGGQAMQTTGEHRNISSTSIHVALKQ